MAFQQIGPFGIFSWSIAGNETCVAVRCGDNVFGFDVGFAPQPMILADHVFISHGHADHIGAIAQHMKKRALHNLPKAKYFMPGVLVPHVRTISKAFEAMSEKGEGSEFDCPLIGTQPGERYKLMDDWHLEVIQTNHSVKSQGYLLYNEYSEEPTSPEIAYLGDTKFSVLTDAVKHCPNLLSTRLLIMESTFLHRPDVDIARAHYHGHTHLDELRQNASLLKGIRFIYLLHFSDRYSAADICHWCRKNMPRWLANRIHPSLFAKQCLDPE